MSHFIASRDQSADHFDHLNHALLRRSENVEGFDEDDEEAELRRGGDDGDGAEESRRDSAHANGATAASRSSSGARRPKMSSALEARRRRNTGEGLLAPPQHASDPSVSDADVARMSASAHEADDRRGSRSIAHSTSSTRQSSPDVISSKSLASSSHRPKTFHATSSSSIPTQPKHRSRRRGQLHGRERKLSDPEELFGPLPTSQRQDDRAGGKRQAGSSRTPASLHEGAQDETSGEDRDRTVRATSPRSESASRAKLKGVSFDAGDAPEGLSRRHTRMGTDQHDGEEHGDDAHARSSGFMDIERAMGSGHANGTSGHTGSGFPRTKSAGMISAQEIQPRKLGTFMGVFLPVSLNILGIILFLRFGFILGQVGLLGALFLLAVSYGIDLLTTLSLSAISTNGLVRGGGAYYLISRSLGPEFGGSIGLIFFAGQALNASMNVLGFCESLTDAFGISRGEGAGFLPEGAWWNFGYGSIVLLLSMIVCLVGSAVFARATLVLATILAVSIISIPISSLAVSPFVDEERGAYYTGWSLSTLRENLFPSFTSNAAGSGSPPGVQESWQSVFGVLFPAVIGILAGASVSGDLRKPSKSLTKGTNSALVFTFLVYAVSFVILAGTIRRQSFYEDVGIVSDVAIWPQLITFGTLASTAFSALMGMLACAKVLQAIARDNLLPILDVFAQGTAVSDTPTYAVFLTYVLCQAVLFVDSVNAIASLVTMTTLLTFGVLSFACFALKAGGAPSFRPSFRYFNLWTAGGGAFACLIAMFFTNAVLAGLCIVIEVLLFIAIHVFSPPKPWGDVTRNLHYHIVRKYLLRIDERKGHVKYWRPQLLLLANNPRTEWNLIIFCNSLKKGALYVLGHIIKGDFAECLPELRRQQIAWLKLVDISGIKSFVDVVIARDEREGARNLILSCGLGGMRPNVVVLGFPNHVQYPARLVAPRSINNSKGVLNSPSARIRNNSSDSLLIGRSLGSESGSLKSDGSEITIRGVVEKPGASMGMARTMSDQNEVDEDNLNDAQNRSLPTDSARRETPIRATTFVGIMEDTLALNKALAVAYNFQSLRPPGPVPGPNGSASETKSSNPVGRFFSFGQQRPRNASSRLPTAAKAPERYIDLWPIQIASPDLDASHAWDTYTMVLQLGTILSYTGTWKGHKLRVSVFVEAEDDVEGERKRVRSLLDNLRIPAELRVFTLSSGSVASYETIVMGRTPILPGIDRQLAGDPWWEALRSLRKEDERRAKAAAKRTSQFSSEASTSATPIATTAESSLRQSKRDQKIFGVSLPPEHLAFFKHNMRIGLAHPRSRRANRTWMGAGEESESEEELSDSDDGGSDLSDELARLGDEDQWFGAGSQGLGLRRSSTVTYTPHGGRSSNSTRPRSYSIGAGSGMPDEPLLSGSTSTSRSNYGSTEPSAGTPTRSRSTPISSATDAGAESDDEGDGTLKPSDRARIQAAMRAKTEDGAQPGQSAVPVAPTPKKEVVQPRAQRSNSVSSVSSRASSSSAARRERSHSSAHRSQRRPGLGERRPTGSQPQYRSSTPGADSRHPRKPLISFNELPNKAQYLILNELIRSNSTPATAVVLTALPAPEAGTSDDELRSLRYLEQLEALFSGGPPVLGVHARQLTMTMSL
ncbi:hypothetical protein OC834_001622 [Tilletia horrida]|nr:hypothetical protein OC834_001622 [Tilletia horrida]